MLKTINDFIDKDRTKVNITMKHGAEFLGADLLTDIADGALGFVHEGGARIVNQEDVLYFDIYLDEDE